MIIDDDDEYEAPDFNFDDYIELPDGRRGYVNGFYEHAYMRGEGSDEEGIEISLESNPKYKKDVVIWKNEEKYALRHPRIENIYTDNYRGIKVIRSKNRYLVPWTPEQVQNLLDYANFWESVLEALPPQKIGANSHTLKCPNSKCSQYAGKPEDRACLLVTLDGLFCFYCDYTQNWVDGYIVEGTWRSYIEFYKRQYNFDWDKNKGELP